MDVGAAGADSKDGEVIPPDVKPDNSLTGNKPPLR